MLLASSGLQLRERHRTARGSAGGETGLALTRPTASRYSSRSSRSSKTHREQLVEAAAQDFNGKASPFELHLDYSLTLSQIAAACRRRASPIPQRATSGSRPKTRMLRATSMPRSKRLDPWEPCSSRLSPSGLLTTFSLRSARRWQRATWCASSSLHFASRQGSFCSS